MAVSTLPPRTLWLGLALWLGVSAAGLAGMAAYANRPGAPAQAPARWPASTQLVLDSARPTLVMLAHPRCDCTRASLVELREVVARAPHAARVYVVFVQPAGVDERWDDTALWKAARAIPGAIAMRDPRGHESVMFGAQTSGQTLLYAADGSLLFSGGATIARGHEGDNPGVEALIGFMTGRRPEPSTTPVFGCPLFAETEGGGA